MEKLTNIPWDAQRENWGMTVNVAQKEMKKAAYFVYEIAALKSCRIGRKANRRETW